MQTRNLSLGNRAGYVDLYPIYYGWEDCTPGHSCGPLVRNAPLLHYVLEGRGVFFRGTQEYPVEAGQVFLIQPGEVTRYRADSAMPWKYVWIGFEGKMTDRLSSLPSPVITLKMNDFRELWGGLSLHRSPALFIIACLHKMFAELFDEQEKRDYVTRAENEIEARYQENISVTSIAAGFSLDRRYLSRLFREKRGIPLGRYLITVRIGKAKQLLEEGIPVLKTAELVGYPDYTAFSKCFRRIVGVSPKRYALGHTEKPQN